MQRAQKIEVVESLNQVFQEAQLVVVAQQNGLDAEEMTSLREQVREAGAQFRVTKNRLTKLALKGTKYEALESYFSGTTAIAYSNDPVTAAKVTVDFAKKNEKLVVLCAGYNDQVLEVNQVKALASLPSLDELRGKIVGLLQAPAGKIASVTQAPAGQLARVFGAYGSSNS